MTNLKRSGFIDSLRGIAVLLMVIYHFCYDLTYFKVIFFDFHHHPFWLGLRGFIVTLFLGLVGISLYLAHHQGINWKAANKRLIVLIACSLVITLVSYFLFPGRTIVFGILHFISLASLLALLFIPYPFVSLISGVGILILGNTTTHTLFNQTWLHWIGLSTQRPKTEDYVPLIPWFGVVLCGIMVGYLLLNTRAGQRTLGAENFISHSSILNWSGRHSLWIYMLHQPILFALLWMTTTVVKSTIGV